MNALRPVSMLALNEAEKRAVREFIHRPSLVSTTPQNAPCLFDQDCRQVITQLAGEETAKDIEGSQNWISKHPRMMNKHVHRPVADREARKPDATGMFTSALNLSIFPRADH